MKKLPIVAILGRANVGKSSIFNRLVGQRQAVVAKEAGTTRDSIYAKVEYGGGKFTLVDTAGLKTPGDEFEMSIQDQISETSAIANLLLVVCDGTGVITDEDRKVAKLARKSGKPIILVINKSEGKRIISENDFLRLGIKTWVYTSATQNLGMESLIELITKNIKPVRSKESDGGYGLALIGRPNVGKSSLFNALAQKQQAIVADLAGTTRDTNRVDITYHEQLITLLDTAGIRRSGKIDVGVEKFSVARAIGAIEESDICILVIDANEPSVAMDQKLAGIIKEAGRGLIMAITKWDTVDKDSFTHDALMSRLKNQYQHVPWALTTVVSAISGQNVNILLSLAMTIRKERAKKIKTTDLNRWLSAAVNRHPPAGYKRVHPKLRYITQTGQYPPEFTIFGSGVRAIHWSYKRYLEREIREEFGFSGTPVIINFRDKNEEDKL